MASPLSEASRVAYHVLGTIIVLRLTADASGNAGGGAGAERETEY